MEPQNNPVPTTPQPVELQQPVQPSGDYKKWLMIGAVILVIVLIFAAAYWYMYIQQSIPLETDNSLTSKITSEVKSLGTELNSIEVEDIENDFNEIDQDLQSL